MEEQLLPNPAQPRLERPEAARALKFICASVASIGCPLLKEVCEEFLSKFGEPMTRTAAAKTYHHALRGGLTEHIAGMIKLVDAIAPVTGCNRDLLIAGCLFHDCGKLFEHLQNATDNVCEKNIQGELLGHISAGMLLVQQCMKKAVEKTGMDKTTRAQEVQIHLLHLVASHHGKIEWGSPIQPKTREAFLLHTIDMLDCHMDMFDNALAAPAEYQSPTGTTVHPQLKPLPTNVASSLAPYQP